MKEVVEKKEGMEVEEEVMEMVEEEVEEEAVEKKEVMKVEVELMEEVLKASLNLS